MLSRRDFFGGIACALAAASIPVKPTTLLAALEPEPVLALPPGEYKAEITSVSKIGDRAFNLIFKIENSREHTVTMAV